MDWNEWSFGQVSSWFKSILRHGLIRFVVFFLYNRPRFGQKKTASQTQSSSLQKTETKSKISEESRRKRSYESQLFAPDPVTTVTSSKEGGMFDGSIAGSSTVTQRTSDAAMTSSDLLKRMRQRNHATSTIVIDDDDDVTEMDAQEGSSTEVRASPPVDAADVDLLQDVRSFVAFRASVDGEARTSELVEHFGSRLPPEDSAKFKAMLQQLCDFRRQDGVGIWKLKPDFQ